MTDKTSFRYPRVLVLLAAAGALSMTLARCNWGVPLTAPSGAELDITANPTAIPVVDGTSTITVVGFRSPEDGGGPLPDGTQIFLTTNVGLIEERVEMQNGIARATLRSNGRAGRANVTAQSGAGVTATLEEPVLIGNAEGINILLTANPVTVGPPDFTSELVAHAFDNDNNPLRDVPIVFTSSAGVLASHGAILTTNAAGNVSDRLTLLNEGSASVTAFSGSISSNSVTVGRGTELNPVVTSISPSSGAPGETLTVTISGANFQPGAIVSFGQGISTNSVTFVNNQTLLVSITIDPNARVTTTGRTVTVTNPDGGSGSLSDAFLVTAGGATAPFITSVSPSSTAIRGTPISVTLTGTNFQTGAVVGFTPGGITLNAPPNVTSSTQIQLSITVDPSEAAVPQNTQFDITVINPDGGQDTLPDGFTVTSAGS